jgi:hypothetical protein
MAKGRFIIDVTKPIPEWGLSEEMSTAVPIAVSGAEIKSTRDISSGMQKRIRAKIDKDTLREACRFIVSSKTGKHSGSVFKIGNRARTKVLFKKK